MVDPEGLRRGASKGVIQPETEAERPRSRGTLVLGEETRRRGNLGEAGDEPADNPYDQAPKSRFWNGDLPGEWTMCASYG